MLVEIEIDEHISKELRNHIELLENCSGMPMWFYDDREKDRLAVNHLIHCMKVVADYYTNHGEPMFFDYSEAQR